MAKRAVTQRCQQIEFLLTDVDGVLTDGRIIYGDNGAEFKEFDVRDGAGLALWHQAGLRSGILTGRTSKTVARRAKELKIDVVIQGSSTKWIQYEKFLQEQELTFEKVCYIGDDVGDLAVLHRCGLAVTVADGCAEAKAVAHHVTRAPGGRGALREVVEMILQAQGKWHALIGAITQPSRLSRLRSA